jgi:hypothetical protein
VEATAAIAARVLLAWRLLWWLLFRLPEIVITPNVDTLWSGCGETPVMIASASVLYAWFASNWDKKRLSFATRNKGLRIARVLYGVAMIPFGVAHFVYLKHTAELVPGCRGM